MSKKAQMPGYWHFVWMFWMQPVTLHYRLRECGVDGYGVIYPYNFLNVTENYWTYRQYIYRLLFNLGLIPAIFMLLIFAESVLHWSIPILRITEGVALGFVLGVTLSMILGIGLGAPFSLLFAVANGAASSFVLGLIFSAMSNVVLQFSLVMPIVAGFFVATSAGIGIARGIAFGAMSSGLDIVLLVVSGGMLGFLVGEIVGGVGAIIFLLRLPFYAIEILCLILLRYRSPSQASNSLRFTPVLYHDLSYFPHPGLRDHIIAAAKHDALGARHVIEVAQRSFGQRKQAAQALAVLVTEELTTLFLTQNWHALIEMRGFWLDASKPLLKSLAECAQFMFAAQQASSNHLRLHSLQQAQACLHSLANQLLSSDDQLAQILPIPLHHWQAQVAQELEETIQLSAQEIPNPFTVGNPIQPDSLWSKTLFRGRERTVAQVEQLLTDANNHAMALIGPRRCGKSSLLNMLPVLLPDTIIVQFDLQDNPADTPMRFYQGLARVAQSQAKRRHNLELPLFDENAESPIEALKQWFEHLETFTVVPRILLCIDEFERLETLFPDKERELPQFMGVVRATIQHKRRLRLLVAGAAPFADLGPIWNDHFINLREIKIGYFDHANATGLLTKPMQEFPDDTISQDVANEVFVRSKGQPFITQAYGYSLVNLLNEEKRKQATLSDLERVEPEILDNYTYYFRGIWQEVPPAGQAALEALAHGQDVIMDTPTRLWLRRRMVITEDGILAIPLFGRWIREKDLA